MKDKALTKLPKSRDDTSGNFVLPDDLITILQRQLHSIHEIGHNLAYTTTFVTYKLSHTTEDAEIMFQHFANGITQSIYDTVIVNQKKSDIIHSYRKGENGVLWLVPKSSIKVLAKQAFVTHIEVFVNFDVNDNESLWYILDFYYDLVNYDEKLKASDEEKARKKTRKIK